MRTRILLLLIAISFLSAPFKGKAQVANKADSLALVDLYNNTNGPNWYLFRSLWLKGPVAVWQGVKLNTAGRVVELNLPGAELQGSLSESLGNLTSLQKLTIGGNLLTGSLPASFSKLINLNYLDISHNMLQGSFPASITSLTHLTTLNLSENSFSGALPATLGALINIITLDLSYNRFSGPIPLTLSNLSQIEALVLNNNLLTGSIPSGLNYANMFHLNLNNNQLSGSIPASLGNSSKLYYLYLSHNQLTGSIPSSFKNLSVISDVDLSYNHLTDSPPLNDFYSINLSRVLLQNNYFTFTGLESVSIFWKWARISYSPQDTILPLHFTDYILNVTAGGTLSDNTYKWFKDGVLIATLTGDSTYTANQPGKYWASISNARWPELELKSDTVTLTVTPQFIDSVSLVSLYNQANGHNWFKQTGWLKGPVSTWYGVTVNNGRVTGLNLGNNNLKGPVTAKMANLTKLSQLDLDGNYLTFNGLEYVGHNYTFAHYAVQDTILPLHLSNHTLSITAGGALKNNVYKWYKDSILVETTYGDSTYAPPLSGSYYVTVTNQLADKLTLRSSEIAVSVPANLKDSLILVEFYKSTDGPHWLEADKWLTGPLKTWNGVTLNANGRVISFSRYKDSVKGPIPASLGSLDQLESLGLNDNHVTGEIPSTLGNLTKLTGIYLQNNYLTGSIPASLGDLSNLDQFDLEQNQLTGNIPSSLRKLKKVSFVSFAGNQLSGSIPDSLSQMEKLTVLRLEHNLLTGSIPSSLTHDGFLALNLSNNLLTGNIPRALGDYIMVELRLDHNHLSGYIPSNLTYGSFVFFTLNDNNFTFDGMELMAQRYTSAFTYSPQSNIPLYLKNGVYYVKAGGTLSNNTYTWYKNGSQVAKKTGDSTLASTGPGTYYVKIKNAVAKTLTLTSDTVVSYEENKVIMPARPHTEYASYETTDIAGWTHYYYNNKTPNNLADDTLLLSLKKNGQDIGTINDGTFAVKLVATPSAGSNTGIKLTNSLITNPTGFYVMNRYWQVTATQQPAASVGVRFYYNNQDLADVNGSYPTHNLTNDKLIFYKAVGGNPDPTSNLAGATKLISIMPGTQPTDTSWVYHKLSDTTQYGEYSVASFSGGGGGGTGNNKALPVTLLNFTGNHSKTDVLLNWQTAQEINAGNYFIERSLDGVDFIGIGSVQATGNSAIKQSYSYIDANVAALNTTKLYYRLKITDKDGDFSYSKLISLQNDGITAAYVLYPNPAHTSATVQFTAATAAKYTIAVIAADGKIIKQVNVAATAGVNRALINVAGLAQGAYKVAITGNNSKQTLTLVKE